MGYRSQVVLAVGKEVMPGFMAALSKSKHAIDLVFKEHDTLVKDYQGDGNILVTWDSLKWDDSFEEINAIEAFLDDPESFLGEETLEGDTCPWDCFKFVRVGEEPNDVEVKGDGFYDIYVERSITY